MSNWGQVFKMGAVLYVVGGSVYLKYMSVAVQPWDKL